MNAPPANEFPLRCDRCRHCLAHAFVPMQLVALFKPKLTGVVPQSHPKEVRFRCGSCGYVNVFHPVENSLLTGSWRHVSLKG